MPGWDTDPVVKAPWDKDPIVGQPEAALPPLPEVPVREPGAPPPLPTSTPVSGLMLIGDMGEGEDADQNWAELNRKARQGAFAAPAQEARKALKLSGQTGYGPEAVTTNLKEIEQRQKQDSLDRKLVQLPRLTSYMARSPQHAAAVADEADKWGTLEYLFGRFSVPQHQIDARNQALQAGKKDPGLPGSDYQPPGWVLAFGRTSYALSNSVQDWAASMYGSQQGVDPKKIAAQRDISEQPVPGDDSPVLKRINSLVGMTPILAAGAIHPALAFGMMYTESSGRNYEDMRLDGWDHDAARDVSNLIGFTSASVGAAMGPLFKFNFLPRATLGFTSTAVDATVRSLMKQSPTLLRAGWDLSKNFVASIGMNIAMASSEATIKEAFESARQGKPFDASKSVSAAHDAAGAWAEMALLSIIPAYRTHMARKSLQPIVQETGMRAERQQLAEQIYDNYEERGLALRSMQEAANIVTAAQAVKDSEFMKSNPEEARALIQHLVSPRATQTVFVDPKALARMPEESLAKLGSLDFPFGASGGVPVNIVDLLMHPDAEEIAKHTAGGPDLLTGNEAKKVNLTGAIDSLVKLYEEAAGVGQMNDKQYADFQERISEVSETFNAQPKTPDAETVRAPAPNIGQDPRLHPVVPEAPEGPKALAQWASDAVLRRPIEELSGLAEAHSKRHEDAARDAYHAQLLATEHAKAGRETGEAEAQAQEAQRTANVSKSIAKAAQDAVEEVKKIGEGLAAMASTEKNKAKQTPRDVAWRAGVEYGEAYDAIMENLGLAPERGYAAPDLSDVYTKMAREQKLTGVQFEGWDLESTNKILQNKNEIGNLTLQELREVNKALTQISKVADAENSIRVTGVRVAVAITREQVAEHLKNIPDLPPGQRLDATSDAALTNMQKAGSKFAGLRAIYQQPHTLFFKMGKVGESMWFDQFIAGLSREDRMWESLGGKLKELNTGIPEEIKTLGTDVVNAPVADSKWVRSQAWHLALHLGSKGTAERVAKGLHMEVADLWTWLHNNIAPTKEQAHEVMSKLVEPHWKLFGEIWTNYEQHFKERGIAPPEQVKPAKYTLHGKEYEGGYGGRLHWLDLNENKPVLHPGSLEALLAHDTGSPATDSHSLIERGEKPGIPLLNWDGVVQSMRKEVHDIALRPFVEDAHKIFSDGSIRGLLSDKMGKQALNEIFSLHNETSFLHVVARGSVADVHTAKAFTQQVMNLQGRAAYSAFSMNFRVMAGQVSHALAAVPGLWINPIHMVSGLFSTFNPDRRVWAHSTSQVLGPRYDNHVRDVVETTRQMTGVEPSQDTIRKTTDNANWRMWREVDGFLSHWVWEMAYAKAIGKMQIGAETVTHDEAVRQADHAVTVHMPSQTVYDHASFARDRSIAGFTYLVRNFPTQLGNVASLNWWEARVSGKAPDKIKAASQFVGLVMTAEIIGKAIIMHLGPHEGQETSDWLMENAVRALFYPWGLGEPAAALYHAVQGRRQEARRDIERMTPAAISVIGQTADDLGRVVLDGDDEAALRASAHLLGLWSRSPLPMKAYDLSNAARNAESPADALKKGMGYRQ